MNILYSIYSVLFVLTLIMYAVLPDMYPGPIDDMILIIIGSLVECVLIWARRRQKKK